MERALDFGLETSALLLGGVGLLYIGHGDPAGFLLIMFALLGGSCAKA